MSLNSTSADEIRSLERRVAGDPAGLVFARLADAYRKAGLLSRALEVVERGLRRHPDYLNARLVRARVLRDLGQRADAERAFESVLEIDASNQVALRALGDLAGETGDFAGARTWYARLLEAEPFAEEPVRALLSRLPASRETTVTPEPVSRPGGTEALEGQESPAPGPAVPEPAAAPEGEAEDTPETEAEDTPETEPAEPSEVAEEEPPEVHAEEASREIVVPAESGLSGSEQTAEEAPEDAAAKERERTSGKPAGELMTPTLADLYLQQGLVDEAIRIYERLLARRPDDPGLAERLQAAKTLAARRRQTPRRAGRDGAAAVGAVTPDEVAREAPRGPSIRHYLHDLIEGRITDDSSSSPDRGSRFERWLRSARRG